VQHLEHTPAREPGLGQGRVRPQRAIRARLPAREQGVGGEILVRPPVVQKQRVAVRPPRQRLDESGIPADRGIVFVDRARDGARGALGQIVIPPEIVIIGHGVARRR